jgi:ATP-binding cassette, subfamily F, member 3
MVLLSATRVSKRYGQREVLGETSLEIRSGDHIALVGPNGVGKTTLLKILTGQLSSDSGSVEMPSQGTVGYLEQHPEFAPQDTVWSVASASIGDVSTMALESEQLAAEMATEVDEQRREQLLEHYDRIQVKLHQQDAYNWEHRVERVLQGLGFSPDCNDRPAQRLSGGQQNRLMLATLILSQPDLMIMDEPNNHLDIESTEWLEDTLKNWPGAFLLVSHDRFFLDQTANMVLELVDGRIDRFKGNYSAYVRQKAERLEVQRRTHEKQQEEIAKLEEFVRKHHYGQKSTQAEDRRKKLDRIEQVERPREIHTPKFRFPPATRTGDIVVRTTGLAKSFDRPLFDKLSLQIERGERWAILGSNGSGKSTLLKCLLSECVPDEGKVEWGVNLRLGYFDQLLSKLDLDTTAAEAIRVPHRDLDDKARRDILGSFGLSGEIVLKPLRMLSGGERNRVMLAWLSAMEANVLILDEPTNHLDLWSRHALEEAISGFDGTVILVTHDRYLVNAVADHLLVLRGGNASKIVGNYDTYKHWLREGLAIADRGAVGQSAKDRNSGSAKAEVPTISTDAAKRRRKYPYRKVSLIEEDIATIESRIEEIHQDMMQPDVLRDGRQIKKLQEELLELDQRLLQLYEHYEEACELN